MLSGRRALLTLEATASLEKTKLSSVLSSIFELGIDHPQPIEILEASTY